MGLLKVLVLMVYLSQSVKGTSNLGKEFYLGIPENRLLLAYPVVHLYITTMRDNPVNVHITTPLYIIDGSPAFDKTITIYPGKVWVEEFSYNFQVIESGFSTKGIYVSCSHDISIQVANLNDLSSDTYLALPADCLGNEYYAVTYIYKKQSVFQQGPTQLLIVGTMNFTTVELHLPPHVLDDVTQTLGSQGVNCSDKRCILDINRCQTFQLQSSTDLTGMYVSSTLPVVVVTGTVWTSVKSLYMGDHMVEQLPPTPAWGMEFVVMPTYNRTAGDIVKVLGFPTNSSSVYILKAKADATKVIFVENCDDGVHSYQVVLHKSNFEERLISASCRLHILSNTGILVVQIALSNGVDNFKNSDPFMTIVPAINQLTSPIVFSDISSTIEPFENYINLVTNVSNTANIFLNGEPLSKYIVQKWRKLTLNNLQICTIALPTIGQNHSFYVLSSGEPYGVLGGVHYGLKQQEAFANPLSLQFTNVTEVEVCANGSKLGCYDFANISYLFSETSSPSPEFLQTTTSSTFHTVMTSVTGGKNKTLWKQTIPDTSHTDPTTNHFNINDKGQTNFDIRNFDTTQAYDVYTVEILQDISESDAGFSTKQTMKDTQSLSSLTEYFNHNVDTTQTKDSKLMTSITSTNDNLVTGNNYRTDSKSSLIGVYTRRNADDDLYISTRSYRITYDLKTTGYVSQDSNTKGIEFNTPSSTIKTTSDKIKTTTHLQSSTAPSMIYALLDITEKPQKVTTNIYNNHTENMSSVVNRSHGYPHSTEKSRNMEDTTNVATNKYVDLTQTDNSNKKLTTMNNVINKQTEMTSTTSRMITNSTKQYFPTITHSTINHGNTGLDPTSVSKISTKNTEDTSSEDNLAMILIPACVLTGVPIICCFYCCFKAFCLKGSRQTAKVSPTKGQPGQNKMKFDSVEQHGMKKNTNLKIDCRPKVKV